MHIIKKNNTKKYYEYSKLSIDTGAQRDLLFGEQSQVIIINQRHI